MSFHSELVFNWVVSFLIYPQSCTWMLWRGPLCRTWATINPPSKNKKPISHSSLLLSAGPCRCGRASRHTGRGGRAGGVARWGTKAAPACLLRLPPSKFDPLDLPLPQAADWEPRACCAHIGTLQSSTDRAVGCLRSRACWVAVVVMEQQDKKQVSLVP